jgi:hypothetical protein|tara:strand:- start:192 stop:515 length:324 start_codon:yes stop_codon:yes gene_type:complete
MKLEQAGCRPLSWRGLGGVGVQRRTVGRREIIGSVLLIEHSGKPTEWSVRRSGSDDMAHLLEIFETATMMCKSELMEGGTIKLFDADDNLVKERRRVHYEPSIGIIN